MIVYMSKFIRFFIDFSNIYEHVSNSREEDTKGF